MFSTQLIAYRRQAWGIRSLTLIQAELVENHALHEGCWLHDGAVAEQALHMKLDVPLAVEMADTDVVVYAGDQKVDSMPDQVGNDYLGDINFEPLLSMSEVAYCS